MEYNDRRFVTKTNNNIFQTIMGDSVWETAQLLGYTSSFPTTLYTVIVAGPGGDKMILHNHFHSKLNQLHPTFIM